MSFVLSLFVCSCIALCSAQRNRDCDTETSVALSSYYYDAEADETTFCYTACATSSSCTARVQEFQIYLPECCMNALTTELIETMEAAFVGESCRAGSDYTVITHQRRTTGGFRWTLPICHTSCPKFCITLDGQYEPTDGKYEITVTTRNGQQTLYENSNVIPVPDLCGCGETGDPTTFPGTFLEPEEPISTPAPTASSVEIDRLISIARSSIASALSGASPLFSESTSYIEAYLEYLEQYPSKLDSYDIDSPRVMGNHYVLYVGVDRLIEDKNSDLSRSYTLAHNKFSDMTMTEKLSYTNGGVADEEDIPDCYDTFVGGVAPTGWQHAQTVPISDQKSCGSCWAFAAVGAMEVGTFSVSGFVKDLSEQQVLDCKADAGTCGGGSKTPVLAYHRDDGLCSENGYPLSYQANDPYPCQSNSCSPVDCSRPDAVYCLTKGDTESIKKAVTFSAVAISFDFPTTWWSYDQGVFECDGSETITGGHVVVIVGYTSDYWIIRNSWGDDWGMNGYIYWKMENNDHCRLYQRSKPSFPYYTEPRCSYTLDDLCLGNCDPAGGGSAPPGGDFSNVQPYAYLPGKCRVYLYAGKGFTGAVFGPFTEGQYRQGIHFYDNVISSIAISSTIPTLPNGDPTETLFDPSSKCRVFLYSETRYSGDSKVFFGPDAIPDLGDYDFDNKLSSIMIV